MKNGEIFKKTMPFVWGRFGMQLALNLGIIIYFAVVIFLLMSLTDGEGIIAVIIGRVVFFAICEQPFVTSRNETKAV